MIEFIGFLQLFMAILYKIYFGGLWKGKIIHDCKQLEIVYN